MGIGHAVRGPLCISVGYVQPQEPVTGPVPQPPAARTPDPVSAPPVVVPPVVAPSRNERTRRTRLVLAIALGVIAILCLGGVGVFVALYDGATQIKRTSPDAVVADFLRSYLINRDDKQVTLFICDSGPDLGEISAFRQDVVSKEHQFSVGIRITWTAFTVDTGGGKGTVTTTIVRTVTDPPGRDSSAWRFQVIDENGWRVCGATRLP